MRTFKYIERCARGEVVFTTPEGVIVMPTGEAVEVPDALAKKLAANNHFVELMSENGQEVEVATKRRGRPPKAKPEEAGRVSLGEVSMESIETQNLPEVTVLSSELEFSDNSSEIADGPSGHEETLTTKRQGRPQKT